LWALVYLLSSVNFNHNALPVSEPPARPLIIIIIIILN
jgi:hypothetical protein